MSGTKAKLFVRNSRKLYLPLYLMIIILIGIIVMLAIILFLNVNMFSKLPLDKYKFNISTNSKI